MGIQRYLRIFLALGVIISYAGTVLTLFKRLNGGSDEFAEKAELLKVLILFIGLNINRQTPLALFYELSNGLDQFKGLLRVGLFQLSRLIIGVDGLTDGVIMLS